MKRMMVRLMFFGLVIGGVGGLAGVIEAIGPYKLAYDMSQGETFSVQVDREHRNSRNFMGNDLTTVSNSLMEYGFTVRSSGDGGLGLEIEYLGWEHEVDDLEKPMCADFSELIGRTVKARLSPVGVVSDLRGFEDLPEIEIPGDDQPLAELRYANDVVGLFPRLSGKPVAPGDSWSDTMTFHEPIGDATVPLTVRYTYTLAGESKFGGHDCLKVEGKFTVAMSGPISVGGLDLELNVSGKGTENLYFAWKKGMFVRSESRAVIEGSADNDEMGIAVPMRHDINTIATVDLAAPGSGHRSLD